GARTRDIAAASSGIHGESGRLRPRQARREEPGMGRYILRRVLFMGLVLWIISLLTFLIFVKLPAGDPARRALGKRATAQDIIEVRHILGLDRPWYVQYGRFARGLVPWPGLFLDSRIYFSWNDFVPVRENIYAKLPVT